MRKDLRAFLLIVCFRFLLAGQTNLDHVAVTGSLYFIVSGYYMYIETSSPRVQGDNALLSKGISLSGRSCLSFYYHMYGSSMGTLKVRVGGQEVFSKSGDQGNNWKAFQVPLSGAGNKEVGTWCEMMGSVPLQYYCLF